MRKIRDKMNTQTNPSSQEEPEEIYDYEEPYEENITQKDYFDDDEQFLKGDDSVIVEKDVLSLFKQSDNVVSCEILNFYDEKGKPRNRMSLRNDPPVLHISSSDGQSADFVLTQNFTKSIADTLKTVEKSYLGIPSAKKKKVDQEEIHNTFDRVVNWAKTNKVKSIFLGVMVAMFIGYTILISI